jgi:hypothetical protein
MMPGNEAEAAGLLDAYLEREHEGEARADRWVTVPHVVPQHAHSCVGTRQARDVLHLKAALELDELLPLLRPRET